jgi:hypothetical protein
MTAPIAPADADWEALAGYGEVRVGAAARARRVAVSPETVGRLRAAMTAAADGAEVPVGIAEVCPDPLVFAVAAGLPRLDGFARSIDGGSTWHDETPFGEGPLYAVSQISEVAQRRTSDGRHLVRVVYLTRFTDLRGEVVGSAEGTSIHIGVGA